MRKRTFSLIAFTVSAVSLLGCRTPDRALDVPVREEFVVPPDDPRYTQPPEAGYRAPASKKEWGSRTAPGGAGGMMGGGGMGP